MPKRSTLGRWSWERHLDGVSPQVLRPMVAYLERLQGTHARSSVQSTASELAHFGRFLARHDPRLASLALLERQRHIEPYLNEVAEAVNHRTGAPIAASTAKQRIQSVGIFLDAIAEWGWPEAPARRLVFPRDAPRLPHPLPRYLPPDQERALLAALEDSPNRLYADALLLLRATGMRIGELVDLELDCVHEVPGQGAWLKVPLGKLLTERMVPIDEETLKLVDRIVVHRSPGRPLRHPRTGKPADFLLTRQGRRVSADTLREELRRAAGEAGLDGVVPHQLRHTYATALVNAGCSLQALMALLGHVSAEMSLRYGRLFDATVRDEYTRALSLAKARLGPVLPGERTQLPVIGGNWRDAPLIKARLAGGYCLRTAAQGSCAYANICEHCPNFRSEASFLPVLQLQKPTPRPSPLTPSSAAGATRPPATAASSNGSTRSSPRPMPAEHDELAKVEAACAALAAAGKPVTFAQVAGHAGISRTTLYRRTDLRAVVDEHRARGHDATTLTGLTIQIDQLRRSLEAVAANVRRHEEQLRRLERARRTEPVGRPPHGVIHKMTFDWPVNRPPPGRSSGCTRPCKMSCWMCTARSRAWRRCRRRWMPGGRSTTPPGRTSRWGWPSRPAGSSPRTRRWSCASRLSSRPGPGSRSLPRIGCLHQVQPRRQHRARSRWPVMTGLPWRWTGWCPRQETCGSAGSRSGSARRWPGGRSPSGWMRSACMYCWKAPGSKPCRPGSGWPSWPGWPLAVPVRLARLRCPPVTARLSRWTARSTLPAWSGWQAASSVSARSWPGSVSPCGWKDP